MIWNRYEQSLNETIADLRKRLDVAEAKCARLELAVWSGTAAGANYAQITAEKESPVEQYEKQRKDALIATDIRLMGWRELQEFDSQERIKEKQRDDAIRRQETGLEAGSKASN